jgi:hypothetical protein
VKRGGYAIGDIIMLSVVREESNNISASLELRDGIEKPFGGRISGITGESGVEIGKSKEGGSRSQTLLKSQVSFLIL